MAYKDILGNEIVVGSFVAYAVVRYRSSALNFGIVKELTTKGTIKVRLLETRDYDYSHGKVVSGKRFIGRNTSTNNFGDMVVLHESMIAADILSFLKSDEKMLSIGLNEHKNSIANITADIDEL